MSEEDEASTSIEAPSPSVTAEDLHVVSREEALAFVDALFGSPEEWRSPLIRYRLSSDFQSDWKEEVGNWLKTAERLSFLDPLLDRLIKRTKRGTRSVGVDPNDRRHSELISELAPAMIAYYLSGTGWQFKAWEPITGGDVDVDLELEAPDGRQVHVQVKAPDQPGLVVNHRSVDGENDERVLAAVLKAAEQLPRPGTAVNLIAVCANRTWPLSGEPGFLVTELVGSTVQRGSVVSLPRSRVGRFYSTDWAHIAGVVVLDYLRGVDVFKYPCTVLLNPQAARPASPDWFPRGRVCQFDGEAFRWIRGEPGDEHTLPDGTKLDERA
ncbi:MAG: hypothetical protein L6Q84_24875 [Polyangiaceae bacterium]|nr:hypothetical protein [Polyangiaceae bacterium]